MKRDSDSFDVYGPKQSDACWQIDNDQLPQPLDDGKWELRLAVDLCRLAEAHASAELVLSTWSGNSVDFGHQGFSVWIAFSGSPPLVKAARDVLVEMIEARHRRADSVHPHAFWQPRIRIADGEVWVPEDAASWVSIGGVATEETDDEQVTPDWDDLDETEDATVLDDFEGEPDETPKKPKKPRTAGIKQSFQYNVRLSYYQRKLERLGGMPEGSVRFVTPDGALANPNMHVGTLRRRWEDDES